MTRSGLALRSLAYYWRTNAAVGVGVAAAAAVLGGALVVGDSVRGTLRDLAMQRLGRTDVIVTSPGWFREALARQIGSDPDFPRAFTGLAPVVAIPGAVTGQTNGRRAGDVLVYGVDDRFWQFHGVSMTGPADRDAFVSQAVADEAGLSKDDFALVRVELPSAVPLESLHGRKNDTGRTLRVRVARVLGATELGDFAVRPSQGPVLAVFVPLNRLQTELEIAGRVNTLLMSVAPARKSEMNVISYLLKDKIRAEDVGLKVRPLPERRAVSVESDAGLITVEHRIAIQKAFETTALEPQPVLTYLANTIQVRDRSVPYSLVTAMDGVVPVVPVEPVVPVVPVVTVVPGIALNAWTARDLQARIGDPVRLEYYVWEDTGRLATRSADFTLAAIVPVNAIDRDLVPAYRGISDSPTLESWDPPFPVDLRRVRKVDEDYWTRFRTTPKAFVPLAVGQRLWGSRFGALTSVRFRVLEGKTVDETVDAFRSRLDASIKPAEAGIVIADVRASASAASRGATDFGEYFLYFSVFLIVSALVLSALFFKLGIEQRVREVGLLRAIGLDATAVRTMFLTEGAMLALVGGLAGAAAAVGYAWLVIAGLRTIWVGAVGTTALTLHVEPSSLIAGAVGALVAALASIWWTLRSLRDVSERRLLAGEVSTDVASSHVGAGFSRPKRRTLIAALSLLLALVLAALGATKRIDAAAAFFGAGVLVLLGGLYGIAAVYRARPRHIVSGRGWRAIAWLGLRNARHRPGRSVLATGVIASAVFLLVSVDAFRRSPNVDGGRASGIGGYELIIEALLPIAQDLNTPEARRELNLAALEGSSIAAFRLRPGDDASCLNLYAPQSPRILGVRARFIAEGRFTFADSMAESPEERANPWLLLTRNFGNAIPVIADANSLTYVLKKKVGDDITIQARGGPVRLRVVGALTDSVFQRELLMDESSFQFQFPDRQGYQVWLVDAPADRVAAIRSDVENALSDHGADVTATSDRLAAFHRVENTYLSTFQMLGGLGLLLGTLGLGTVLLRNALERRRELALMRAVGYRPGHFILLLAAECALLLTGGLLIGMVSAALAVAPAVLERGGRFPLSANVLILLVLVLASGILSTIAGARVASRGNLLAALRSE